jgi:glycosyltransferase involved in cell wall biosynthesis
MAGISAVIPTHNRAHFVVRAIRSVLAQESPPGEVIVVDDASQDGTRETLRREFGTRVGVVRSDTNVGPAAARNLGAREAAGEWLAFLDSDDEWAPGKLSAQRRAAGGARISVTGLAYITADGEPTGQTYVPSVGVRPRSDGHNPYQGIASSILLPRDVFYEVSGFPEHLRGPEDWVFALRLLRAGYRIEVLNQPLVRYRLHATNMMRDPDSVARIWPAMACIEEEALLDEDEIHRLKGYLGRAIARTYGRAGRFREASRWTRRAVRAGTPAQAPGTIVLGSKSVARGLANASVQRLIALGRPRSSPSSH